MKNCIANPKLWVFDFYLYFMNSAKAAVIDYGMGNLMSVLRAWQFAGADARIISAPADIQTDDILVFPGQGSIIDTMKLLKATGFDSAIKDWVAADKPFFGICLGQQALFEHSEEGDVEGLGIFKGSVKRLRLPKGFKVPHMGWNRVKLTTENPLLTEALDNNFVYYVHSFYVPLNCWTIAKTEYIGEFSAAMRKDNFFATQFHPEKSGDVGERILKNFIEL